MRQDLTRFLWIAFVLVSVCGCSQYERRWNNPPLAADGRDSLEGSYIGKWESKRYAGAQGRLWCILTRKSADQYVADFKATWHGIFSSQHTATLQMKKGKTATGPAEFSGESEIKMWIGSGHYRCKGQITPSEFNADYDAAYDRGRFLMQRARPLP
jgi:hypothetical protein